MIYIKPSPTADTRTCDVSKVDIETLEESSFQHISDVSMGLSFFIDLINKAILKHDADKIIYIDKFYADFKTGFETTTWWDNHRQISRHHLNSVDGIPKDVNLIDVLEMIADCVMAGMARSGEVYPILIDPNVLYKAFVNTTELLKKNVEVIK